MKQALHLNLAQAIKLMLITLLCFPVWSTAVQAQEAEPYAVFADGVLTFKYDAAKPAGAYGMNRILVDELLLPEWYVVGENVKKVVFDNSFAQARPTNCSGWFFNFANLTIIEGIKNLNTSNVTDMNGMFDSCSSLTSIDLSNFDTSKVTDMGGMFYGCSSLTSIDLSNFDTSKVTNMAYIFYDCSSLTSLDLSNFDTSKVTNMSAMFDSCSSLTSLDLSNFDTSKLTNMSGMFDSCSSLTSLDLSNLNTSNVTNMIRMFISCSSLTSLDLSNFDTSKVTHMWEMFSTCSSLTSLDLSNFDTSNVETMQYMFSGCSSLKTIYASDKFVTKNVENGYNMFKNCTSLKGAIKYDANKPDHKYANYTTGYFTKKDATAIHQVIDSNNEKAEYYNVQGKRISKMQRGLNIVRRGGKVVKQVSK